MAYVRLNVDVDIDMSEFDAPQFCHDWITVARKTVGHDGLRVMVRGPRPDGTPSKRTGKIPMAWLPY